MKPSEYTRQHAEDGRVVDVEKTISMTTLIGKVITIIDMSKIPTTKYGSSCYLLKISEDTGCFTTNHVTKQLDQMISEGCSIEELRGSSWTVVGKHIDAHKDKNGKEWEATDIIELEFLDDASTEE